MTNDHESHDHEPHDRESHDRERHDHGTGGDGAPRRSLLLAGGGVKVAFQAGVLQVLLDEARLRFDHVDGASGGIFNLAMYCQACRDGTSRTTGVGCVP